VGIAQLRTLVQTVLEQKSKINLYRATTYKEESKETPSLKTQNPPPSCYRLLGTSQAMRNTREIIQKIAPTQASVYIYGESGTGKEQAARMIHELSGRSGAFVPVNCGAIPEQLMESEFFGYKRGAFTGADRDHTGFFQQAHGGTLFLDEVADLPLSMQVKLLRAIQENTIRRLGHHKEEEVDTRIISASHKDIASMVEHELFRQDLYYRLNVIPIKMPPLRDMSEDILDLVNHILKKHQASSYILNDQALLFLKQYHFPGNVRELENMIERAIIFSKNHQIRIEDFSMNHVL
jgi:two-component system response regulator PilR (NtrC family)